MDGVALGYDVYVVNDATRGISEAGVQAALREMTNAGVKILNADQVEHSLRC
jgi:nicotinamidase-related amidase